MFKKLLPRETSFFDYFEAHSALILEACQAFAELAQDGQKMPEIIARVKEIEHKADDITHQCIQALHHTFITPIDRHDIHRLIKHMDDVIDSIDAASARIALYEIQEMRPEAREFGDVLVRAATVIGEAVSALRNIGNISSIHDRCTAIHQLENEADNIHRASLVRLFKEGGDPFRLIQWKEILEYLERAADQCEDVANIIEGVLIEAS